MLIGVHVSVAGGYLNGLSYADQVGAECIQFFAKSPRRWRGPAPDVAASGEFSVALRGSAVGAAFTHTAYLLNLSTTDPELYARSIAALADEIVRAGLLGVDGVVSHVGNAPDGDYGAAARRTAIAIASAFEAAGDQGSGVRLLLENTAGGGSSFGCSIAQLADVVSAVGVLPERLGVCIDTCHAFAYGMPLDSPEGWAGMVSEIHSEIGLERLGLIHANDAMFAVGSRRDRHAWIGEGLIGEAGFSAMLCDPRLAHVPAVMEMPGEKPMKDEVNMARLLKLREQCGGSASRHTDREA